MNIFEFWTYLQNKYKIYKNVPGCKLEWIVSMRNPSFSSDQSWITLLRMYMSASGKRSLKKSPEIKKKHINFFEWNIKRRNGSSVYKFPIKRLYNWNEINFFEHFIVGSYCHFSDIFNSKDSWLSYESLLIAICIVVVALPDWNLRFCGILSWKCCETCVMWGRS